MSALVSGGKSGYTVFRINASRRLPESRKNQPTLRGKWLKIITNLNGPWIAIT
jgi:hypothetical protein